MSEQRVHRARSLMEMLQSLHRLAALDDLSPDPDDPLGRESVEFFTHNWKNARDGLLSKTSKIRVQPNVPVPDPRIFFFEMDIPYKRKQQLPPSSAATVELVDGPLRGTIRYRADIRTADPDEPTIGVFLDPEQCFYHPNYSQRFGVLCIGDSPPQALNDLLEHLYWILTYDSTNTYDAVDHDAASYFALAPDAMMGLEDIAPLY